MLTHETAPFDVPPVPRAKSWMVPIRVPQGTLVTAQRGAASWKTKSVYTVVAEIDGPQGRADGRLRQARFAIPEGASRDGTVAVSVPLQFVDPDWIALGGDDAGGETPQDAPEGPQDAPGGAEPVGDYVRIGDFLATPAQASLVGYLSKGGRAWYDTMGPAKVQTAFIGGTMVTFERAEIDELIRAGILTQGSGRVFLRDDLKADEVLVGECRAIFKQMNLVEREYQALTDRLRVVEMRRADLVREAAKYGAILGTRGIEIPNVDPQD